MVLVISRRVFLVAGLCEEERWGLWEGMVWFVGGGEWLV